MLSSAVDRILQAQEEGEIVLIFGDRDVDGISSTTILYEQLKSMGIEAEWKLPGGNDGYGLSIEAVDEFYKKTEHSSLRLTAEFQTTQKSHMRQNSELTQ